MEFHVSDMAGLVGAAMVLGVYARLQYDPGFASKLVYPVLNGAGAALIIASLMRDWNLAAFVVEAAWLLVSLYGIWKRLGGRAARTPVVAPDL